MSDIQNTTSDLNVSSPAASTAKKPGRTTRKSLNIFPTLPTPTEEAASSRQSTPKRHLRTASTMVEALKAQFEGGGTIPTTPLRRTPAIKRASSSYRGIMAGDVENLAPSGLGSKEEKPEGYVSIFGTPKSPNVGAGMSIRQVRSEEEGGVKVGAPMVGAPMVEKEETTITAEVGVVTVTQEEIVAVTKGEEETTIGKGAERTIADSQEGGTPRSPVKEVKETNPKENIENKNTEDKQAEESKVTEKDSNGENLMSFEFDFEGDEQKNLSQQGSALLEQFPQPPANPANVPLPESPEMKKEPKTPNPRSGKKGNKRAKKTPAKKGTPSKKVKLETPTHDEAIDVIVSRTPEKDGDDKFYVYKCVMKEDGQLRKLTEAEVQRMSPKVLKEWKKLQY